MKKNNQLIPKFPKKLPGTFWGITTFFNPKNYENRIKNYKIFFIKDKKLSLINKSQLNNLY